MERGLKFWHNVTISKAKARSGLGEDEESGENK